MMNLMTALYKQIDGAHEYDTYRTQAPEDATYPYVVFKLYPIDNTEDGRDDYMLEISCWDKSESPSDKRVLELADSIRKALTNSRHLDDRNLIYPSKKPSLGYVPDPNDLIKRYDVGSLLKTYRR